ncbi:GNAT family N-acetyltransferase [Bdellovibrio sp. HCB209]|uniref:GNAT family N-acetyltransferase n=1 Tax=Bdellovibrio sp. HCB209 TaxID=3394354 RepID=UPI0039B58265
MAHNITAQRGNVRLRPVTMDDAEFIVELRTDSRNARFIHATSANVENQRNWISSYLKKEDDFYFIVEHKDRPIGTIGIYDVNKEIKAAEWGRWIIKEDSVAAPISALLVFDIAFNILHLEHLYSRTMTQNEKVVAFHDKVLAPRIQHQDLKFLNIEKEHEIYAIHHSTPQSLPKTMQVLEKFAKLSERFL